MSKDYEVFPLLLEMAKRGCLVAPRRLSRIEILKTLGLTPWRFKKLVEAAEEEGYIERRVHGRMVFYVVTERGRALLRRVYDDLKRTIDSSTFLTLRGYVVPGLGEGAIYMGIPRYVEAFKEVLGYEPYPGTLNIKLVDEDVYLRRALREKRVGFRIEGFRLDEGRESCGVTVYKAMIMANGVTVSGAALDIDKTKHGDEILELIAPVRLRDELRLKDGDKVEVVIPV
ncbi:DUF120 domain-containing protein [Thermofilum pendens]|uniref:Riboflavin kinase n=1 Tax=Thermofilum pendens (strain DSM 2475 / Hrk 5) TaxID=368408 RepID=RIFK_THEPD|nr:DUF120 domain-containing protein [Thermofilum pendens]A1RWC8.1 RecName: Full=Riboflavin kinase; Short=RFK; AltName: Full=CTP-dependent riboflavin kinase; AltName: Full=CTP:riboflavin 5'-phosphotransferase; AltName: Full=Flavokinase [Thermofilum pendens Hrk 5]ABL77508.1 protein of unknown function DUF120 [Thermofilum pendens Hrk 5]